MARQPAPRIDPRDPVLGRIKDFLLWVRDRIDELQADIDAGSASVATHASTHISGGTDAVNGDKLDIDITPSGYTSTVSSPTTTTTVHLGSHLNGIGLALTALSTVDFGTYYSPVGAWILGSSRTTDLSGNGHTLTENGTMRLGASPVRGLAASFYDSTNYLTCSDAALNITGAWSAEAVVNLSSIAGGVIATWTGTTEVEANNITWTLGRAGASSIGGTLWEQSAAADVTATELGKLLTDEWIHIAQTRSSGGVFKTYINGALISTSGALTMPVGGSTGQMYIGGPGVTSHSFLGLYLAVYNTTLTAAEVLDLAGKRMGMRESA